MRRNLECDSWIYGQSGVEAPEHHLENTGGQVSLGIRQKLKGDMWSERGFLSFRPADVKV